MMVLAAAVPLTHFDLLLATGLVVAAGLVSLGMRLDLERKLAWSAIRCLVQLTLMGYVLKFVFETPYRIILAPVVLVMLLAAAREAVARPERTFRGAGLLTLYSLGAGGLATLYVVTGVIIDVEPWYDPRYLVPLLGMIVGNNLTAASLILDTMLGDLDHNRDAVEMELAHGATAWEAARPVVRQSVRRAMIPMINTMMVVGLVKLPGMMTGQILEGADPLKAVKYQALVMFMLAASVSMTCMALAWLVYRKLFNDRHQLAAENIRKR